MGDPNDRGHSAGTSPGAGLTPEEAEVLAREFQAVWEAKSSDSVEPELTLPDESVEPAPTTPRGLGPSSFPPAPSPAPAPPYPISRSSPPDEALRDHHKRTLLGLAPHALARVAHAAPVLSSETLPKSAPEAPPMPHASESSVRAALSGKQTLLGIAPATAPSTAGAPAAAQAIETATIASAPPQLAPPVVNNPPAATIPEPSPPPASAFPAASQQSPGLAPAPAKDDEIDRWQGKQPRARVVVVAVAGLVAAIAVGISIVLFSAARESSSDPVSPPSVKPITTALRPVTEPVPPPPHGPADEPEMVEPKAAEPDAKQSGNTKRSLPSDTKSPSGKPKTPQPPAKAAARPKQSAGGIVREAPF